MKSINRMVNAILIDILVYIAVISIIQPPRFLYFAIAGFMVGYRLKKEKRIAAQN